MEPVLVELQLKEEGGGLRLRRRWGERELLLLMEKERNGVRRVFRTRCRNGDKKEEDPRVPSLSRERRCTVRSPSTPSSPSTLVRG